MSREVRIPFPSRAPRPFSRWRRHLPYLAVAAGALGALSGGAKGETRQAAPDPPGDGGRITATFHGLRGRDGYLRVSLYDRPDGFPDGTPTARRDVPLQALDSKAPLDALTVTFEGLPSGTYAVCAFHDRNGSGRLAQNFLGIPQEEWGMSGNPRPRFHAPRFDQARLGLGAREAKSVSIILRK